MKRFWKSRLSRFFIVLALILIGFSSCRTTRELPAEHIRPMDAGKLIRYTEEKAFDFNDLTIRRINVLFSGGETDASFRASLQAIKNKKILATVSKMSFPVGRVLLTPKNVVFVNYLERTYFEDDYSYLSRLMKFNLDFDIIQSLLTNPSGGAIISRSESHDYQTSIENGKYVLQSGNIQNQGTAGQPINFGRRARNNPANDVQKKFYFNPQSFNLEKLILYEPSTNWILEVNYGNYTSVEDKSYPGSIDIKMISEGESTELKIRLSDITTQKIKSIDLNIPEKYEQIRVN
jgi:hypothetical protein